VLSSDPQENWKFTIRLHACSSVQVGKGADKVSSEILCFQHSITFSCVLNFDMESLSELFIAAGLKVTTDLI
jgi:hypothetical protein